MRRKVQYKIINNIKYKKCTKWELLINFSKDKRRKDKLTILCKQCIKIIKQHQNKQWRKNRHKYTLEELNHKLVNNIEYKYCSFCKQWELLTNFHKAKNEKDGLHYICKIGTKTKNIKFALKNPTYHTDHKETRNNRSKKWQQQFKLKTMLKYIPKPLQEKLECPQILYIIKHKTYPIIKIGITSNLDRRLYILNRDFNGIELIYKYINDFGECFKVEQHLKYQFKKFNNREYFFNNKLPGFSEWYDDIIQLEVLRLLNA